MTRLKYLQTNGKLKNSTVFTYAFNLPAIGTCIGAGICKDYCFAASEQKRYPSALAYRKRSLDLSKGRDFERTIGLELELLMRLHEKKGTKFAVRIHASGDFYSPAYVRSWFNIIGNYPNIRFYAYTKSIAIFKYIGYKPANFSLIFSMGSNQDQLIDVNTDRHARIFQTEAQAIAAGYTLANEDDAQAWNQGNHRIGLVIFGATKKFAELTKVIPPNTDKSLESKQQRGTT